MTDIEHAKKYAERIRLTSMYNPKAEIIAETACLYGFTYKNKRIADLEAQIKKMKADVELARDNANKAENWETFSVLKSILDDWEVKEND